MRDRDQPHPAREPFDRQRFRRLLGMYLVGVAIGCVLVGVILSAKRQLLAKPAPGVHPAAAEPAP